MLKGICFLDFFFFNYGCILRIFPSDLQLFLRLLHSVSTTSSWHGDWPNFLGVLQTVFLDRTILNVDRILNISLFRDSILLLKLALNFVYNQGWP